MYLPKHQYTKKTLEELDALFNLRIGAGSETANSSIIEQISNSLSNPNTQVVVTSTGKIFSTRGINFENGDFSAAIELVPTKESNDPTLFDNNKGSSVNSTKLPPSSKEKQAGVMKRCFYKNTSTGKVKEILRPQAIKLANNRERFEQVVCIDWEIKGPAKDQTVNGYFLEGIETRNQKRLSELKEVMPGAEVLINSPAEYVEDTLIKQSQPIQKQDKDIVIPSPGKRL